MSFLARLEIARGLHGAIQRLKELSNPNIPLRERSTQRVLELARRVLERSEWMGGARARQHHGLE